MLGNARSIFIPLAKGSQIRNAAIAFAVSVGLIFLLVACSGSEGNVAVAPSPSPPVSEEVGSSTDTELDLRFNDAVEEYVKTTWSTWTLGEKMGQCLVANAGSLTTEAKEAIIKHGVEEAFDELSGVHLQSLASVWNACEVEASTSDAPTSSAGSVATLDFESTIGVLLVVTHFQD